MIILQLLGIGCQRCLDLKANLNQAVQDLPDLPIDVEEITEIDKILSFQIYTTPALIFNGKIIIQGDVPNTADLTRLILQEYEKIEDQKKKDAGLALINGESSRKK